MKKFWDLYMECYRNKRIKYKLTSYEHKTNCDQISNIRLQSGDSRFFSIDTKKYGKLLTTCTIDNFLELFESKEDLNIDTFVSNLIRFNKKNSGGNCIEKLLNSTISFQDITDVIFNEEGFIYKQLKKFNPAKRDIMISYIKQYIEYFETRYIEKINKYRQTKNIYSSLIYIISKFKTNLKCRDPDIIRHINSLRNNWDHFKYYRDTLFGYKNSITTDIYTLCRSFKYLDYEQDIPIMNILYFGNSHIESMLHFLTNITKQPNENEQCCRRISY
jgi:hypothetical protein